MDNLGRSFLIAYTVTVSAAAICASEVQAQSFGGFFTYSPAPRSGTHYAPPQWIRRHQALPRKRTVRNKTPRSAAQARSSEGREVLKRSVKTPSKNKRQALAVSKGSVTASTRLTCETAKTIVAAYGFTNIEAKVCVGKLLGFAASRDGTPFAIQILAASGELAKVRRLR